MVGADGDEAPSLLAVHAHPDDESITTGGLLARCADAGITTTLLTCTDGRYGPVNPRLGQQLNPDQLARTRKVELHVAARILGIGEVLILGYHDSNMSGLPENHVREAFWAQPMDDLVAAVVRVLRDCRPQVVVTYDAFGNTGHPDHIQAHRVTMLAVAAAAEPRCFPETGPPWAVQAMFHPVYPVLALRRFVDDELARGRPHPFGGVEVPAVNYGRPDSEVTHRVAITGVYKRKARALRAHRTQVGPHYPPLYRAALARRDFEHFRLVWGQGGPPVFAEVFESVRR